jgi:vancomycin resistance protein VanW
VVERYRHSFDVFPDSNRVLPFGSGATCVYPYRDLMVRNDTDMDFQLVIRVGEENLEGEWRADRPPLNVYKVEERNHEMKREYWGGFSRHNELYRQRFDPDGTYLDEEYITENHAPFSFGVIRYNGVRGTHA